MDPVELLKPGALFRARGRDYRLEHRQKDLLLARAVDTEEEALFYLPLEGQAIRLTSLGLPPAEPGDPALHDRSIPTRVGTTTVTWPVWLALPVHPHACGDYAAPCGGRAPGPVHPHACGDYGGLAPEGVLTHGPSPRVWGLRR